MSIYGCVWDEKGEKPVSQKFSEGLSKFLPFLPSLKDQPEAPSRSARTSISMDLLQNREQCRHNVKYWPVMMIMMMNTVAWKGTVFLTSLI